MSEVVLYTFRSGIVAPALVIKEFETSVHIATSAVIHNEAIILGDVEPFVVIGCGTCVAAGSSIGYGSVIEDMVDIFPNCIIEPFCYIGRYTDIGKNTIVRRNTRVKKRVYIPSNSIIES